jgi:hypothetical protein
MTQRTPVVIPGLDKEIFLDFKLLPCSECQMLSSALFTGICSLNANISEHTVCSEMLAFTLDAGEQSRRNLCSATLWSQVSPQAKLGLQTSACSISHGAVEGWWVTKNAKAANHCR